MGGEKFDNPKIDNSQLGSPPRGRGKGSTCPAGTLPPGITPAWAGKRAVYVSPLSSSQDHPRVGGEKVFFRLLRWYCLGSPPRGRGKGLSPWRFYLIVGITPAWAGKSRTAGYHGYRGQDHPRVGGEKDRMVDIYVGAGGSPPRGRGKVWCRREPPGNGGITPAWAGKRLKRSHRSGIFISGPIPFHSVLHRPAGSGGSRAGRDGSPAGQPQNTGPA